LQTNDGSNFGQRLWADIRVSDDETNSMGWQVVSAVLTHSGDSPQPSATTSTATSTAEVVNNGKTSEAVPPVEAPSAASSSATANIPPVKGVLVGQNPAPDQPVFRSYEGARFVNADDSALVGRGTASSVASASTSKSAVSNEPTPNSLELAYDSELKLLAEMGFTDKDVIIPLLQEHVKKPVGPANDPNSREASQAGLQRVIVSLLGQSMVNR